jgi:hypothetical protein
VKYELLVDGRRRARLADEDDVRSWLARYREDHAETDPDAAHVQLLERGSLSWLTGGRIVDRERFLQGSTSV